MTNTPAGWYPQQDGQQRYWDGEAWTSHVAPGAGAAGATPAAAQAAGTAARPWFKKKRFIIPGGLVALAVLGSAVGGSNPDAPAAPVAAVSSAPSPASSAPVTAEDAAAEESPSPTPTPTKATPTKAPAPKPKPKPAEPELTLAQENAKSSAESYLDYSGFSKKGLIEQLEFEGYKSKDITAALATVKVNWKAEAVESAESYLDYTSFSRSGLIEQLEFEGYTSSEAKYAVDKVGL